eukprot:g2044.t1
MKAWAEQLYAAHHQAAAGAEGKKGKAATKEDSIFFLPDAACALTRAIGLNAMKPDLGGERSDRYSMYVVDGEIKQMFREEPGQFSVSDADTMKKWLEGGGGAEAA